MFLSESTTPGSWILFVDIKDLPVYYFINFDIFISKRLIFGVLRFQKVGPPGLGKRGGGLLGHVESHGVAEGDRAPSPEFLDRVPRLTPIDSTT